MAEALGDVIINLRSKDVNMASGLAGIRGELEHLSNHVVSFGGLMHVVMGGAVARKMFHEMHEGLATLGEGFSEAQAKGASFGDSIDTGVAHLFKMKSAFEQVAAAAKNLSDIQEGIFKGDDKTADFLKSAGKKGDVSFGDRTMNLDEDMPLLSKEQQTKFKEASDEYSKLQKKILIGDEELHKKSPTKNITGLADQSQYLTDLKDIKRRHDAGDLGFFESIQLAASGIVPGAGGIEKEISSVQKRVDNLRAAHDSTEDRQKELGQQGAFAEADNAKEKIVGVWDNLADGAKKAWGAVGKVVSNTADAFKKDITKENEKAAKTKAEELDRKMRQEAEEAEKFFKQQEEQKKKQDEIKKRNADEAKKFIEESDPLAKLKDEFKEIDRLVGTGDLTSDQAKKAKDKEIKEFNAANRKDNKVEFRSADVAANDMLKKSLEDASIQKEIRDILQKTYDKKPEPAPMA